MAACAFLGCFNTLSFISLLCHPLPLSHGQNTVYVFISWTPLSCYTKTFQNCKENYAKKSDLKMKATWQ
jgi:hypothetical protein